jgi:hypothetical protein
MIDQLIRIIGLCMLYYDIAYDLYSYTCCADF